MIVKKKGIYVGTIQEEPEGICFDYGKDNLYLMNRFLGYLIQNKDSISERINELFSSENSKIFLSI